MSVLTLSWRGGRSGRAEGEIEESHLPWIDSAADNSNGRHLGPTLEEVAVIRSSRKVVERAPQPSPDEAWTPTPVEAADDDKPSEEQLRALVSLEVAVVPTSKEHAMHLIREARELQLAEGLGFSTTNRYLPLLAPAPSRLPRSQEHLLASNVESSPRPPT